MDLPKSSWSSHGSSTTFVFLAFLLAASIRSTSALLPLTVTNLCQEDIYPAILTQGGTGPQAGGFLLHPGKSNAQNVSADWRGRVWGRTNCTISAPGSNAPPGDIGLICTTGDCGPYLVCPGAGQPPATLAEFTMSSDTSQTFYDLSLVDGYNVPMGIIYIGHIGSLNQTDIPPNLTNPRCIGTAGLLAPEGDDSSATFSTNSTYPIPLDQSVSDSFVRGWCPWPLQLSPPQRPGDGVYPYPDDNIQRPLFNPCLSACAKWNSPQYCCTGKHDKPDSCGPSYYSTQAKKICPDAYSYAYDDHTSTFIIPQGGGFEIVFCPPGRSTNILATLGSELSQIPGVGSVPETVLETAQNITYINSRNSATSSNESRQALLALAVALLVMCMGGL